MCVRIKFSHNTQGCVLLFLFYFFLISNKHINWLKSTWYVIDNMSNCLSTLHRYFWRKVAVQSAQSSYSKLKNFEHTNIYKSSHEKSNSNKIQRKSWQLHDSKIILKFLSWLLYIYSKAQSYTIVITSKWLNRIFRFSNTNYSRLPSLHKRCSKLPLY